MRRALLALITIATIGGTPEAGAAAGRAKGFALDPVRGIGPVSLGETQRRVERGLHRDTRRCQSCLRMYADPRGNISVRFSHGRASGIETFSPQVTLHGVPLGAGPKRLRRAHALHHWRHVKNCGGNAVEIYVYGSGPSTSITFGRQGTVDVNVTPSGFGGCGGQ